jgi:glycosyltransferase involved in cell wall biosynthesis
LYYSDEYWRLLAGNRRERWSLALQRGLVGLAVAGSRVLVVQQPGMIGAVRRCFSGVPADRFCLMPNAAPPAPAEAAQLAVGVRERLGSRLIVNGIAHYNPHRNLEVLLGAMQRLSEAGRDDLALVVAVGPDDNPPDSARFVEQVNRAGRDGSIFNLGRRLSLAETYAALWESDVMVYPSLSESFSAAYVMAMECDVPLVAADLEFARTICGQAAAYFGYDRPDDLAARLIELADGPERRRALVERGREQRRAYTWSRMLAGFLEAIDAAAA